MTTETPEDRLVERGLVRAEHVRECREILNEFVQRGVSPLPSIVDLLLQKGYIAAEETVRAEPASPAPLPPQVAEAAADRANRAGRYVRVSRLGRGGMGEVWKAWDLDLGRWVALKFLNSRDPEELARFRREARTCGSLSHPNIGAIYEFGDDPGCPFIAMQFVDGQTLADLPRDDFRRIVRLVRDAARAVSAAHHQGVVHRDLKPANVMVEGERVFVMDFGLAKRTALDSPLSLSGSILGTPAYMAPEQAAGRLAEVGPKSDVYSLGATLYDLLAGQPPAAGPDLLDVLQRVARGDIPPIRRLAPRVDRDLETIVAKCLEREPARRYVSAEEFALDLDRWLAGEPVRARRPSLVYKLRKFATRRKALVAVTTGVLLAAVGVAVGWRVGVARRVDSELADARRLEAEGRDAEAREAYRRALWLDSRQPQARTGFHRTDARLKHEEERKVAQLLEKEQAEERAERARPHVNEGWKRLIELERLLSRPDASDEETARVGNSAGLEFARGLSHDPANVDALLGMARLYRTMGHPDEALRYCDRALQGRSGVASVHLERALINLEKYEALEHSGDRPHQGGWGVERRAVIERDLEAVRRWSTDKRELAFGGGMLAFAEGRYPEAAEVLLAYAREAVTDAVAWRWAGSALFHAPSRFDEAVAAFREAIKCRPRDAGFHMLLAYILLKKGDLPEARAAADRAVELNPAWGPAFHVRGEIRYGQQDLEGAIHDLTKAVELDPTLAETYLIRALAKSDLGDWKGAIADCTRAIELNREYASAYNNRGRARLHLGDHEGALRDLDQAVALDSTLAEAHGNRGVVYAELGNLERAIAEFTRAIELKPDLAGSYCNRGVARSHQDQWEEAEADFSAAAHLDPKHFDAQYNLGVARLKRDNARGAVEPLDRAIELRPDLGAPYAVRAQAHDVLGDAAKSRQDARKALERDLSPEYRKTMEELLRKLGEPP